MTIAFNVRLTAGLYRLSGCAHLKSGQMSVPSHRYLRVVG